MKLIIFRMSWLSDLAKGAEALLEKVDQSTASALQNDKSAPEISSHTAVNEAKGSSTSATFPVVNAAEFKVPSAQTFPGIYYNFNSFKRYHLKQRNFFFLCLHYIDLYLGIIYKCDGMLVQQLHLLNIDRIEDS